MNREIKFRAWDNDNECLEYMSFSDISKMIEMLNSYESYFSQDYFAEKDEKTGNPLLMQFTGLHDKNGKEIYEGDLISESGSKPYEVKWKYHFVKWVIQSFQERGFYRDMDSYYAKRNYVVIGNIYENPELCS